MPALTPPVGRSPAGLTVIQGTAQVEEVSSETLPDEDPLVEQQMSGLAALIRRKFEQFKRARDSSGVSDRLTAALRQYNGKYSASKLAAIRQLGGSEVYSRLTTVKCRGATAMLRDVFLGSERPWEVLPTPVPTLPTPISEAVNQMVLMEAMQAAQQGMQLPEDVIQERKDQLYQAAMQAATKKATDEAVEAGRYLEDILTEGGFYQALGDFLVDLPIFPYAVIKGPVVRLKTAVKWVNGTAQPSTTPVMMWNRVAPDNVWFTPGASRIEDASVIEKIKVTRSELNALIDMPGFYKDNIIRVLDEYDMGLVDWIDSIGNEMADMQDKENPNLNDSELLDTLEFHGPVKGSHLLDLGFTSEQVPDKTRDYHIVAWLIGRYIIKAQINPNPRAAKPYYTTAFEKVPGALTGHGIPEIINDIQDVSNACLRSLVNNMAIASGPQVVINESRLSPSTDANSLSPWKRWRFTEDPMGSKQPFIDFFQPDSNAKELLAVYKEMQNIADETSAIPRYITGSEKTSGAASTASGLSMLMNNASKVLQTVAAQVDKDIVEPALRNLYDMLMLTDKNRQFRGDESIVVRGVQIAMQRETDRVRRLEFLQLTANPVDMEIVGIDGRAEVLRAIAEDLGLPGREVVPSSSTLEAKQRAMQMQALQQSVQGAPGSPAKAPGNGPLPSADQIPGPREPGQAMQPPAPV